MTLTLEYEGTDDKCIFKNQKASYDSSCNLLLAPLINAMREQGFDSRGHSVLYFANSFNAFVFVGKDPIPESACIALDEIDISKPIRIKLRPNGGKTAQAQNTPSHVPQLSHKSKDIIESLV